MTYPLAGVFGIIDNPLIDPPFIGQPKEGESMVANNFLLLDTSIFAYLNGSNFLLLS